MQVNFFLSESPEKNCLLIVKAIGIVYICMFRKPASPVLENMSQGKLSENMQLELSPGWDWTSKEAWGGKDFRKDHAIGY